MSESEFSLDDDREERRPLPHDLASRLLVILIAIVIGVSFAFAAERSYCVVPTPATLAASLGKLVVEETLILGILCSCLALVWALFLPSWAERLILWTASKLVFAFFALGVVGLLVLLGWLA